MIRIMIYYTLECIILMHLQELTERHSSVRNVTPDYYACSGRCTPFRTKYTVKKYGI